MTRAADEAVRGWCVPLRDLARAFVMVRGAVQPRWNGSDTGEQVIVALVEIAQNADNFLPSPVAERFDV